MPLGPFDGRVATLHPQHPEFYIATPNQDDVFSPPGPCNVYARFDGRYGQDDHTQWPQPFSHSAPYLCCIPKCEGQLVEDSIMWWNPTRQDFEPILRHGWDIGIGFLPNRELRLMEQCYERLNQRVGEYRKKTDLHPLTHSLLINLRRTLSRLRAVAMTRKEVLFECRQVQRQWMELRALMDYIEIYQPHMDSRIPPAKSTANVVGCFVREAHVAERLFSAGIPYWLIRPLSSFSNENILTITSAIQPKDVLELDDYPMPFPRIYFGDSNYHRFCAISEHGLKSLCYTDLFSDGNPRGIKPHEFVQRNRTAGPARDHQNNSARPQPCKLHLSRILHSLILADPRRSGKPGQPPSRDKFDLIDSPYMSLSLESWQKALAAVDQSPEMLFSRTKLADNDGKYAFPEPGIFCSGDNANRRNRYLTTWTVIRDICIYRLASNASNVRLLSGQDWRTLLGGRAPNSESKAGASREFLKHLLSPEATELGIDVSNLHKVPDREFTVREAQENMWGISELSFRFELLMLDRRALDRRLFENRRQELSSLVREELVLCCFYFRPDQPRHLASVSVQNARRGLASPNVRDRLPYLNALRQVMFEWVDYHRYDHLARLPTPTVDTPEIELLYYEYALARYYTQTYFHYFGRAAIIPATLPETL